MTAFIQQSLTEMQGKFTNMSDQVGSLKLYFERLDRTKKETSFFSNFNQNTVR